MNVLSFVTALVEEMVQIFPQSQKDQLSERRTNSSMQEDDEDQLAKWKTVGVRVNSVSCSLNISSCEWFPAGPGPGRPVSIYLSVEME